MDRAETTAGEAARLRELDAYEILDTPPEPAFDRITTLAARLMRTPIALISLMDQERQWFKSRHGLEAVEIPRSGSFCEHVTPGSAPLVVPDARHDARFSASPFVVGPPGVRFYAGSPLRTPRGHVLGTLCVIDTDPHPFGLSADDRRTLADLAAMVADELEFRRTGRALAASEQRLRSMTESAPDAIVCTDGEGSIMLANPAAERMFGYAAGEMAGGSIDLIVPARLRGAHQAGMARLSAGGAPRLAGRTVEVPALRRDGTEFPVEVSLHAWRQEGAHFYGAILRDLTERRRAEERIRYLAHYDTLTGLPNRELFGIRLREAVVAAGAGGPGFALILLDLDRLKDVNGARGHAAGDALLRQAAERLQAALPGEDCSAARVGGDAFALLLTGAAEPADAVAAAGRIVELFARPFRTEKGDVETGVSAGVALCPAHSEDADTLLTDADLALRRAKADGRGRACLFDPAMGAAAAARRAVCDELRRAVVQGEFRLRYQPQICVSTGRVVGVEALLRWQHPWRGLLRPAEFIDLIEAAEVAVEVGAWVLREACVQVRRWRDAGLPDLRVGVNLSAAQFRDPGLVDLVLGAVAESSIPPALLELEITEGTYLGQGETVAGPLRRLRERGVRVAFDDFGTGYASLSYLKSFPLDRLKIDRSFVRDIATDHGDAAIVRAIIGLARNLDLAVIAEGVETGEQEEFLRRHGCHELQGFRYGRPLEAEAIPAVVLGRLPPLPAVSPAGSARAVARLPDHHHRQAVAHDTVTAAVNGSAASSPA